MSKASQEQQAVAKYFKHKPTLYIPGLSIAFKSLNVGIFLSQLLYWQGKGKSADGWVFKTIEEMRSETGLSRCQQNTAIRELKRHGVLEVKLKQVPAKRHFRLDMQKLYETLPSLKAASKLTYPNPPVYYVKNEQTITKTTHETTSKNNEPLNKFSFQQQKSRLLKNMDVGGRPRSP